MFEAIEAKAIVYLLAPDRHDLHNFSFSYKYFPNEPTAWLPENKHLILSKIVHSVEHF